MIDDNQNFVGSYFWNEQQKSNLTIALNNL